MRVLVFGGSGFVGIAYAGETPNELGRAARFGMPESADHFVAWWRQHGCTVDGP